VYVEHKNKKTWLVTGGCGFIGSHLVDAIMSAGDRVVNIDNLAPSVHIGSTPTPGGDEFIHADIGDADVVMDTLKRNNPWRVINLAAETHVDRSISSPGDFFKSNVESTWRFVDAVNRWREAEGVSDFLFVHVSTDEVYGSRKPHDPPTDEMDRYHPRNPYAASKAASDHVVRAWGETFGLPHVVTNCSNNYGPRQFREKFIPNTISCAMSGREVPIYGDGRQVREWLHVKDHCDALVLIAKSSAAGETYNISSEDFRENIWVAKEILKTMEDLDGEKYGHLITHVKDRIGHDCRYAIKSSKLQKELGWRAKKSLSDGLRETVAWYMNNREWMAR